MSGGLFPEALVDSEILVWLTKYLHVGAISLWAAGLLVFPFLLAQRRGLEGEPLYRLHAMTRFLYVVLVSPAAFVAVASGTALIFFQATFVEWFSAKLVFVGLMAALHVVTGLLIIRVFMGKLRFGRFLAGAMTLAIIGAVIPILWFVLAKPDIDALAWQQGWLAPGGLKALLAPLNPWTTP